MELKLFAHHDPSFPELSAEPRDVVEEGYGVHAEMPGLADVYVIVVNKDAFRRIQAEMLPELFVDLALGLYKLPVRGDKYAVKTACPGKFVAVLMQMRGSVGQYVKPVSEAVDLADQFVHAGDLADRKRPPVPYGVFRRGAKAFRHARAHKRDGFVVKKGPAVDVDPVRGVKGLPAYRKYILGIVDPEG